MKKLIFASFILVCFLMYSLSERALSETDKSEAAISAAVPATPPAVAYTPGNTPTLVASPVPLTGQYKDGTYIGNRADAVYGFIQVKATIANGKLTQVNFLEYPNDRGHSIEINLQAMPILTREAISAQTAQVDTVSGATDTSLAFRESLGTALAKAL